MRAAESYRHLPYDVEVEQALFGKLIFDNDQIDSVSFLSVEDLYDPLHGRIYSQIRALWEGGVSVTPLSLHAELKSDVGLQDVGGFEYLRNLAFAASPLGKAAQYAGIIKDLSIRRSLIRFGETVVSSAYDAPKEHTGAQQIQEAEGTLFKIAARSELGQGAIDFEDALDRAIKTAEEAYARGDKISGVPTGFSQLDTILGGLQPSDLIILAARPSMGKTSLATNAAFYAATRKEPVPVLFFSLEMAAQQLSARILSDHAGIEAWKMRGGRLEPREWENLALSRGIIAKTPLYIDDSSALSIAQIASRSRRMKREKGIGLIVLDYLQLVSGSRKSENRTQELTEITKGLKSLAKELNVPVLALSQLSRGVDAREDKRPILSDLRESGSIEQDADVVAFVYRESYYLKNREPDVSSPEHAKWLERMERAHRKADLLIEKHRNGATGRVELLFDERFTRFSNPN